MKHIESARNPSSDEILKVQKGLFFVSLYACIEYTLTTAVSEFLAALQATPLAPMQYQAALLPTILNREFNAVRDASKRTVWDHRLALVRRVFSPDTCTIDNGVFPAEGTNVSTEHFTAIWRHLQLPGNPIPLSVNPWMINEIKEHRNAIAHGRERAASIGSRFTVDNLEDRHRAVEALCTNTILSIEEHLTTQAFLATP